MAAPHQYKVEQHIEKNNYAMTALQKLDQGIPDEKVKKWLNDAQQGVSTTATRNFNSLSAKSEELFNLRQIEVAQATINNRHLLHEDHGQKGVQAFYKNVNNAIDGVSATGIKSMSATLYQTISAKEQNSKPSERVTVKADHKFGR